MLLYTSRGQPKGKVYLIKPPVLGVLSKVSRE